MMESLDALVASDVVDISTTKVIACHSSKAFEEKPDRTMMIRMFR
jgi:hypothetical protein